MFNYKLLNNLKKTSAHKNTLVILMHDTGDVNKTYDVLEDSINYLKSQGYTFKTFHSLFEGDSDFSKFRGFGERISISGFRGVRRFRRFRFEGTEIVEKKTYLK